MILRVERFVLATFAVACLCNCATTKPDSTDSPSTRIDLPDGQKHNEEKNPKNVDEEGGEAGENVAETGSQHNPTPDGVSHDQSPKTVSELAEIGESPDKESSFLNQSEAPESKYNAPDSNSSSKTEPNEATSTVDSQSEISNPPVKGKDFFALKRASDSDEKTVDMENTPSLNSNAEADLPLAEVFGKDSILSSDSIETDPVEVNLPAVDEATEEKPLDQTDLGFSASSEGSDEPASSSAVELEFSTSDSLSGGEPENSGNSLAYESEKHPESISSESTTSKLDFSDSNSNSVGLKGINSSSLTFSETNTMGTNLGHDKSTSIHLGPGKDIPVASPTKNTRRYVGLSQWLSRSAENTSSRDEVYLGHSEPKVPAELESYIEEGPLVGIRESVPWEYDSIAKLLRPHEDELLEYPDEKGFDYETVRKYFGLKNSMSSTDKNENETPTKSRYDSVLQWFDGRDSTSMPSQAKPSEVRNYSKVLNWIRNEGR